MRGELRAGFWWGNLRERDNLEGLRLVGRIMIRCKLVGGGGHGLDSSGSDYGQVAGSYECSKEHLVFIKCGEFF